MNPEYLLKKLKKHYPAAKCSLFFSNALELLVATILSAQCTDERVNKVTKDLFKKYKTVNDYAKVNIKELQEDVKSTGFYRNKAKSIKNSAIMIIKDFQGKVPNNMNDLIKLPGVGRKTANVVLGNYYNKAEGIVVDTHVGRISQRTGLTKNKTPEKIEQDLMKIIPKKDWTLFSHLMINHGRKLCQSRKPKCEECFLKECPKIKVQ